MPNWEEEGRENNALFPRGIIRVVAALCEVIGGGRKQQYLVMPPPPSLEDAGGEKDTHL